MEMMIAPGETGVLAAGWFAAVLDDVIVALTRLDYEGLERIERDLLATVAAREQISFPAEDGVERERQIGEIRRAAEASGPFDREHAFESSGAPWVEQAKLYRERCMGTLSALVDLSRNALVANQAALDVTGKNVANQNVTGYTREDGELYGRRGDDWQRVGWDGRGRECVGYLGEGPGAGAEGSAADAGVGFGDGGAGVC